VVADSCRQSQTFVKPEAAITVFDLPMASLYAKPEAKITVFEFLMMSGVSLETC
jgi:hypothetical protein